MIANQRMYAVNDIRDVEFTNSRILSETRAVCSIEQRRVWRQRAHLCQLSLRLCGCFDGIRKRIVDVILIVDDAHQLADSNQALYCTHNEHERKHVNWAV